MIHRPLPPKDLKVIEAKSPRLKITTWSSIGAALQVRCLTPSGLVSTNFTATTNRAPVTTYLPLPELPSALSISTTTSDVPRGRVYCQAVVELAGLTAGCLAADYITSTTPLTWPGGNYRAPTDGRGWLYTLSVPDPAAGANFVATVPNNSMWQIRGVLAILDTDVTVAIRELIIYTVDFLAGRSTFARPTATQIASLTMSYTFTTYITLPATYGDIIAGHLPNITLLDQDTIHSDIQNLQAGDQVRSIYMLLEEWINP